MFRLTDTPLGNGNFHKGGFFTVEEGLCVQIMHIGPFDDEPAAVAVMDE